MAAHEPAAVCPLLLLAPPQVDRLVDPSLDSCSMRRIEPDYPLPAAYGPDLKARLVRYGITSLELATECGVDKSVVSTVDPRAARAKPRQRTAHRGRASPHPPPPTALTAAREPDARALPGPLGQPRVDLGRREQSASSIRPGPESLLPRPIERQLDAYRPAS